MTGPSIDPFKNPKPWMTDGAISFMASVLKPTDMIVEFGGGSSSLWWAERSRFTYTVDASATWAPRLIQEMAKRPELMTKWAMLYSPCDWHSTHEQPKPYWEHRRAALDTSLVGTLERLYLQIPFEPDVIVIDGSVRPQCVKLTANYVNKVKVRYIVVDNMETMGRFTEGHFLQYDQKNFTESDPENIPAHQNGKWMTSVFVRNEQTTAPARALSAADR